MPLIAVPCIFFLRFSTKAQNFLIVSSVGGFADDDDTCIRVAIRIEDGGGDLGAEGEGDNRCSFVIRKTEMETETRKEPTPTKEIIIERNLWGGGLGGKGLKIFPRVSIHELGEFTRDLRDRDRRVKNSHSRITARKYNIPSSCAVNLADTQIAPSPSTSLSHITINTPQITALVDICFFLPLAMVRPWSVLVALLLLQSSVGLQSTISISAFRCAKSKESKYVTNLNFYRRSRSTDKQADANADADSEVPGRGASPVPFSNVSRRTALLAPLLGIPAVLLSPLLSLASSATNTINSKDFTDLLIKGYANNIASLTFSNPLSTKLTGKLTDGTSFEVVGLKENSNSPESPLKVMSVLRDFGVDYKVDLLDSEVLTSAAAKKVSSRVVSPRSRVVSPTWANIHNITPQLFFSNYFSQSPQPAEDKDSSTFNIFEGKLPDLSSLKSELAEVKSELEDVKKKSYTNDRVRTAEGKNAEKRERMREDDEREREAERLWEERGKVS